MLPLDEAGLTVYQLAMIEAATLVSYVAVVLDLFLIPGPAVLLVFTRTAQAGRAVGISTGLGVAAGDLVLALAAAIGLSAILMTSVLAFNVVKWAGVAYLLYLGLQAFFARDDDASTQPSGQVTAVTPSAAFWQAIPAEVLNPKTFFLSFLPQFVHPEHGAVFAQFSVLGLIFVAMSAAFTTLLALSVRPLGRVLGRLAWLNRWKGKIIGTIFVGLGVKVATQQQ